MTRVRILSKRFNLDEIVSLQWIEHRDLSQEEHSIEADTLIPMSDDKRLLLKFVNGGWLSLNGDITLVDARWGDGDDDEIVIGDIKFWLVDNEAMTAQEIADLFDLAASTVTRVAESGELTARKAGRIWLIKRTDAEARWGKTTSETDQVD